MSLPPVLFGLVVALMLLGALRLACDRVDGFAWLVLALVLLLFGLPPAAAVPA